MMSKSFTGPLFVVGMSRSGTKLLRDILNNSHEVAIPSYESHFLPYLIQTYKSTDFPLNGKQKIQLINLIKSSIFYNEIKSETKNFKDFNFDALAGEKNIQAVVQKIMTKLAQPNREHKSRIWGDKTPNNLFFMLQLKEAFPDARFIHIIRDPRERALSTKKAWNASTVLSAFRWKKGVDAAKKQALSLGDSYKEIKYENLIASPESEIIKVCQFLGIEYNSNMLELKKSAEVYKTASGKTKNAHKIISGNTSKYKNWLTAQEIERIESICGETAVNAGYYKSYKDIRISKVKIKLLEARDSLASVYFHIKRWGLFSGTKYLLWRRKVSIRPSFSE